jgi:hypothetical protein
MQPEDDCCFPCYFNFTGGIIINVSNILAPLVDFCVPIATPRPFEHIVSRLARSPKDSQREYVIADEDRKGILIDIPNWPNNIRPEMQIS